MQSRALVGRCNGNGCRFFLPLSWDACDFGDDRSFNIQLGYQSILFSDVPSLVTDFQIDGPVGRNLIGAVLCPALVVPVIRFLGDTAFAVLCIQDAERCLAVGPVIRDTGDGEITWRRQVELINDDRFMRDIASGVADCDVQDAVLTNDIGLS